MPKLTKTMIDALAPTDTDYFVWDDALPGFGVRVWPSGKKTFLAQYRAGRRTRRMKIGTHGPLTVEEARREAKIILGDVARGEDPAEERATRRKSMTVAELCATYLDALDRGLILGKGGRPKKTSTLYTDRGRIDRHIVPLLGKKLVRDVTRADVTRFLRDVTAGKTATIQKTGKLRGKSVVRGGAGTAARTVGLLGGILSFAVSEGVIDFNPTAGVKRPADNRRDRRLTAEDYRALGDALTAPASDAEHRQVIHLIRLLALTGARLGEIVKLRWEEVDRGGQCLRLSDSKEGKCVRPLGRPALDVLAEIEAIEGNPYVLTAVRGTGHFGGAPAGIERIMRRAGLEGVTAHTLRHGYASVAADLGFTESTIAAILGHAAGSVTGRYIHHLDAVLLAAADKVARDIHRQMTGTEADVVPLPAARKS